MIKGYSKINDLAKSTELYNSMILKGLQPTIITNNTYLTTALKCKNLQIAENLLKTMEEKDVITYSSFMRGLLKMNKIDYALKIHE